MLNPKGKSWRSYIEKKLASASLGLADRDEHPGQEEEGPHDGQAVHGWELCVSFAFVTFCLGLNWSRLHQISTLPPRSSDRD